LVFPDIKKPLHTVRTKVQKTVQDGQKTFQDNKKLILGGTAVAARLPRAIAFSNDAFQQFKNINKGAEGLIGKKTLDLVHNPPFAPGGLQLPTRLNAKINATTRFFGIPSAGIASAMAVKDIRQAIRSGSRDDIITATRSTLNATNGALNAVTGGFVGRKVAGGLLGGTVTRKMLYVPGKEAAHAFKKALPNASNDVLKAVRSAATNGILKGGSTTEVGWAISSAAGAAARQSGSLANGILGSGKRFAAKASAVSALSAVSKEAGEVAVTAAFKATSGPAAKALSRFAPGVNVAIAAVDVALAGATLMDPKASTGKKVTSVITAVGSGAAATNLPIFSQAGATLSTVSSIAGAFC